MATVTELIELAKQLTPVLDDERVQRIIKVSGTLKPEQINSLHTRLLELQEKYLKELHEEHEMLQKVGGAKKVFESKQKMSAVKAAEAEEHKADEAEADRLLEELNQL